MYPVLMAADILMFNAHQVPVGRDQVQHIEMARDIAASFNHLYGEHFTLPVAAIEDHVATLPGLDGRKMSKSYDNTIPLFVPREQLRKLILGIVTDSTAPGVPKDTTGSALFQLYQAFASPEETQAFAQAYANGIAWGDAKQQLFERLNQEIAPMRAVYDQLIQNPAQIERILKRGAEKARGIATPFTVRLRQAVGLRALDSVATSARTAKVAKSVLPSVKQYREADGRFYFKLTDGAGQTLLQSQGFVSPREVADIVSRLRSQGSAALPDLASQLSSEAAPEAIEAALASWQGVL
jgi:tryptophanyl-tRNA synthetase